MAPVHSHSRQSLAELARPQLVALAKQHGLRANVKSSLLVDQLADLTKASKAIHAPASAAARAKRPAAAGAKQGGSASALQVAEPSAHAAEKQRSVRGGESGPQNAPGQPEQPVDFATELKHLVEHDQRILRAEAEELSGGDAALLAVFEAKLEQHKRDILAEIDARVRSLTSSGESSTPFALLPAAELRRTGDVTPPSPFVQAMNAGMRASPSLSPISPGKREREPSAASPEGVQPRKKVRIAEDDGRSKETALKAPSPGVFNFFQSAPPARSVAKEVAPSAGIGRASLRSSSPHGTPLTPPANPTLFGTERDGSRFGDMGQSPSRAFFGLISRK